MLHLKNILILVALQYLLDLLFVYLYPSVNPLRATFIGLSALLVLLVLKRWLRIRPLLGFLPIFSSAFFGALLVQSGVLISKSLVSGAVHAVILVVTYGIFAFLLGEKKIKVIAEEK